MQCKSIAASNSKAGPCGYAEFIASTPPVFYSTLTYEKHLSYDVGNNYGTGDDYTSHRTYDVTTISTKTLTEGGCSTSSTTSGSAIDSWSHVYPDPIYNVGGVCSSYLSDSGWDVTPCVSSFLPGAGAVTTTTTATTITSTSSVSDTTGPDTLVGTLTETWTLSGPVTVETTAELIDRTVADLPAYGDEWDGYCSAFRNLSPDESSYSIRRTKYRIAHSPTGTCYLKVWLQSRFTPEGGGDDIITPLPAYTWSLTGNPCFPDDTKSPGHADNLTFGDEAEEQEPSEDGTTTIEIAKYSCLVGYEPGEGDPDGFPPVPAE